MAIAEDPQGAQLTEAPAAGEQAAGAGAGVAPPPARASAPANPPPALTLSVAERRMLSDLFAIVSEHAADSTAGADVRSVDRARVQEAFVFACEHHAAQRRKSGEDFIVHPVGVARICASMRLDTETLCAALLHDTIEDTSASIEEVRERFGDEIGQI